MIDRLLPIGRSAAMWAAGLLIAILVGIADTQGANAESSVRPLSNAVVVPQDEPVGGNVPGNALGNSSRADYWGSIRRGAKGGVTIPNPDAGTLIQSQGED